jgi:putative ABC transport system permease protein
MKRFIKRLIRRRQLDRELEDELRFHLDQSGDARRFGNAAAIKEKIRDMWAFTSIESWWQDVRYALRTLAKNPGATVAATLALALGIGANTTVFTIVHSALSFNMGVGQIDRLVVISATDAAGRNPFTVSPVLADLRSQVKTLDPVAAYRFFPANLSDGTSLPERVNCVRIAASGFGLIQSKPILGRPLLDDDERADARPVVILTHRLWQNRYGADPNLIGKTIRVNDEPRAVVGVMPPGIQFPEDTDMWTPITPADLHDGRIPFLFGRLAEGVKLPAARAEIDAIARNLTNLHPDTYKNVVARVDPLLSVIGIYAARRLLYALFFAVTFVLLIACADVANLLLARASARSREISIRIAIGAGRLRIIRQLLVESALLACIGGFFGWFVAIAGLRSFERFALGNGHKPSWVDFSVNSEALAFLAVISIGTGILFGLAPALRLANVDINSAVKDGGQSASGGTRGRRLANLLVVFEMVLCVVLLTGAGLLIRSTIHVYNSPLGVNPANVLTMHVNLPAAKYPRPQDQIAFHDQLKTRLSSLAGVEVSAIASALPTSRPGMMFLAFEIEQTTLEASAIAVSPDYFRVIQALPLRGRLFTDSDQSSVMVNQSFASKYWPGQDPLGKYLRILHGANPRLTIVGIVPNIQQNVSLPADLTPLVYLPYRDQPQQVMFIAARTQVPPATLTAAFRKEVQQLDPNLPAYDVGTLEDRVSQSRLEVGAVGTLFSMFAFVAMVLAFVGLYGVVAHSVSQRTREIGVRIALGGTEAHVLKLVFAQGMGQVAVGLVLGLPVAFAVARVLRSLLVDVAPGDPVTFAVVIILLMSAGVLGCAIPARRAARVDPIEALRHE